MNEHIGQSYEDALNALGAACARLGGLAEAQLGDAVDAVVRRDPALATKVLQQVDRLDEIEADIKQKASRLIALRPRQEHRQAHPGPVGDRAHADPEPLH